MKILESWPKLSEFFLFNYILNVKLSSREGISKKVYIGLKQNYCLCKTEEIFMILFLITFVEMKIKKKHTYIVPLSQNSYCLLVNTVNNASFHYLLISKTRHSPFLEASISGFMFRKIFISMVSVHKISPEVKNHC